MLGRDMTGKRLMQTDRAMILLKIWHVRCHRATVAHYYCTNHFGKRDAILTIVNVVAAIALLWLGVEAPNKTLPFLGANIPLIGVFGVVSVISSVLQYILDYKSLHFEHKRVATEYAALDRRLEKAIAEEATEVDDIRRELDRVAETAPSIPSRIWKLHNKEELQEQIRQLQDRLMALGGPIEAP
jgi:hypothetical protein